MDVPIVSKFQRASRMIEEAQTSYKDAKRKNARHRKECEAALASYGAEKANAMDEELPRFVAAFERLRNVDLEGEVTIDGLPVDQLSLDPLRELDFDLWDAFKLAALGGTAVKAAAGSGAVAGAATWTVGVAGAAASTGTAISSLSGAAATNATLAWLGGGSLAAGGGGVALGTMVLTGAVAAPVLLVGGIFVNRKGNQALADAEANAFEVEEFVAQMKASNAVLDRTAARARDLDEILRNLRSILAPRVNDLENWVSREKNFKRYSAKRGREVAITVAIVQIVATLVSTPLTTRRGGVTRRSKTVLTQAQDFAAELVP